MRRILLLTSALLALLTLIAPVAEAERNRARPVPAYRADGRLAEWRGTPTNLAGRSQLSRGELIYTDFLYDDYGADNNGTPDSPDFSGSMSVTAGDYRYPPDAPRYGYNAADLREIRFAADARALHLFVALQTIQAPDAAAVTIAIDTDGNPATGAATAPDGAGTRFPGADRFVHLHGTGGRVTDAAGAVTPIAQAVNLGENVIEADVPLAALGTVAPGARWWAVAGLAGPGGGFIAQKAGETAAFDAAMPGDDDWPRLIDHWGDHRQAVTLAGGDLGAFAQPLDVAALQARQSRGFRLVPGFYNAIFRSGQDLGEGIDLKQDSPPESGGLAGYARPAYRSRFQPYALSVPPAYFRANTRVPLLIYGHPQGFGHNLYRTVSPTSLLQMGEQRGSLVITPLARGTDSWYLDSSLLDVVEAWNDARRRFHPDPDRTSLGGYSMGGYLSYRLGLLMPDAFARVSMYVGPPKYFHWTYPNPHESTDEWRVPGDTNLIVDNGQNLPFQMTYSNLDELVPVTGALKQLDDFRAAGNPYQAFLHQADEHFSHVLADSIGRRTAAWLEDARLDRAPTEVRFKRYPSMDLPRQRLVFDHAYWVRDIAVRSARTATDFGEVWATNLARGGFRRRPVADATGVSAGESGLSPAAVSGQHIEPGAPLARANGFELRLQNIGALRLRTALMGLDRTAPVTASLRGDGLTTLRLDGPWANATTATLDGGPVQLQRARDGSIALVLSLTAGREHALRIRPLLAPPPRACAATRCVRRISPR
ncbi:MAG: hypothetical protein ACR2NH_09620 [Solirubrobacteraceae bacterium]